MAMLLVFVFFSTLLSTSALYFHIGETDQKCFIEEIPDETMVVGNYKVQAYDHNVKDYMPVSPGIGMHVEVRDPSDKVILSRTYAAEGRFTFTSHSAGEHIICLHSNSSAWLYAGQLRVHLEISVGEHAVDYKQVQAKDKLSELQLRVRQLLDQVEQITKEQNYQRKHKRSSQEKQRFAFDMPQKHLQCLSIPPESKQPLELGLHQYREERFRQTSENTNQRVLWWAIAQTLILLLTGFWQMQHLKSFFQAKKLV